MAPIRPTPAVQPSPVARFAAEGIAVTEQRLHVDGEDFVVTPRDGGLDFTWVSGPHDPPYGFSSGAGSMSGTQMRAAIARFLAEIDPDTGYLG